MNIDHCMRELAERGRTAAELPDPGAIWWKAEMRRRLEARDRAMRPMRLMERLGYGACAAAAVLLFLLHA